MDEYEKWVGGLYPCPFGCLINSLIYVGFNYNISMHIGFKFNRHFEYVYCGHIRYGHCGHIGIVVIGVEGCTIMTERNSWLVILDHMWSSLSSTLSSLSNANGTWGLSKLNFPPPCPPSLSLYEGPEESPLGLLVGHHIYPHQLSNWTMLCRLHADKPHCSLSHTNYSLV